MHTKLAIGIALTLSLAYITVAITPSFAINDKFTTDCEGPGSSGGPGDCPGQSEGSGPHDETLTNPSGKNQPPGQQEPED